MVLFKILLCGPYDVSAILNIPVVYQNLILTVQQLMEAYLCD